MIVKSDFFKNVPKQKRNAILAKLEEFQNILKNLKIYTEIPKSFWVRRILGTEIFKFRINTGDRILFKYLEDEEVMFLAYRNHDRQIITARNMSIKNKYIEIDITTYEVEDNEEKNDIKYIQDEFNNLDELNQLVIEDEYIYYIMDENDEDEYLKHISEQQYEALKIVNKPVFLNGYAGCGKSIVGIRRLLENESQGLKSLYLTRSKYLRDSVELQFQNLNKNKETNSDFKTIEELFYNILGEEEKKIVDFCDFSNWIDINLKEKLEITDEELWYQIINVIKGKEKYLSREEYIRERIYDYDTKIAVYKIFVRYNKWLKKKEYDDEMDLLKRVRKKLSEQKNFEYDFIIIDEMQDMYDLQIVYLLSLVEVRKLLCVFDENQITSLNEFNIGKIKSKIYKKDVDIREVILDKNFRNTREIEEIAKTTLNLKKIYNSNFEMKIAVTNERKGERIVLYKKSLEEMKSVINAFNNDVEAAIIVWSEKEKEELRLREIETTRVFTIEEIKGLDYKQILCIGILSKLNEFIRKIKNVNSTTKKVIEHKVNGAYIALTRARNQLYLIEKKEVEIDEQINKLLLCKEIVNLKEYKLNNTVIQSVWIEEAEKLESAGCYIQAAEAYRKAGDEQKAKECELVIIKRKREARASVSGTAIRIETTKDIKYKYVRSALNHIKKMYNIEYDDLVEVVISNKSGGIIIEKFYLDGDDLIKDLANKVIDLLRKNKSINKKKVTMHIALIKENIEVELLEVIKEDYDTIIVRFNKFDRMEIELRKTKTDLQKGLGGILEKLIEGEVDTSTVEELFKNEFNSGIYNDEIEYNMKFLEADDLMQEGNYNEAMKIFQSLIDSEIVDNSMKSVSASSISGCKFRKKQYEEGAYYGELAIKFNIDNTDGYVNAGVNYLNFQEYEKALSLFERAKNTKLIMPDHVRALKKNIELAKKGISNNW